MLHIDRLGVAQLRAYCTSIAKTGVNQIECPLLLLLKTYRPLRANAGAYVAPHATNNIDLAQVLPEIVCGPLLRP